MSGSGIFQGTSTQTCEALPLCRSSAPNPRFIDSIHISNSILWFLPLFSQQDHPILLEHQLAVLSLNVLRQSTVALPETSISSYRNLFLFSLLSNAWNSHFPYFFPKFYSCLWGGRLSLICQLQIGSWAWVAAVADLQHPLKGVQGRDWEWEICALGKIGRTGLQIDIFRRRFYEPNSCISSYLEKH